MIPPTLLRRRPPHSHDWKSIRRGYPQRICKCGAVRAPGGVLAGRNTVNVTDDLIRQNDDADLAVRLGSADGDNGLVIQDSALAELDRFTSLGDERAVRFQSIGVYDFDPFDTTRQGEDFGGGTANAAAQNIGGGVRRYTSGTTAGQFAQYYALQDLARRNDNAVFEYRIRTAPTGTLADYSLTVYAADVNGAFTDYGYFQAAASIGANWIAGSTGDGVTFTTTDTGVAYVLNTWFTLRMQMTSANIRYFINGTLVATHVADLPTGTVALSPYTYQDLEAGAVAKSHDVDYWKVWTTRLT